ncbi:MAG: regulator [Fibrobacteres bacterium]|nr:regulator [Fibrobacterota bacterium]
MAFLLAAFGLAGQGLAAAKPGILAGVWEKPVILCGESWKYHSGDSLQWARPDYDASHWDSAALMDSKKRKLVETPGFAWFRITVELGPLPASVGNLAIRHLPLTPQEFYWDGVLVGRTGMPSTTAAGEKMGEMLLCEVPKAMAGPGPHVLAIRLSAHNPIFYPNPLYIALGDPATLELELEREAMIMFFLAGVFIFGAIYRFLNYRATGYGRNTFFFSLFVLSCSVYIIIQYIGLYVEMSERTYDLTLIVLGVAWYFMISMVPDYFIFAEKFPYRWLVPSLLIGGLFVAVPMGLGFAGRIPFHHAQMVYLANQIFTYMSVGASIWVIAWAVWRKQTGSGTALIGILCMLAGITFTWGFDNNWGWAAGIAAHIIFLARAQSLQMSERIRLHRETELRSARLEIELLKKNIQPHFLLNSLNSIIAWLEEEPKTAVTLVNALADELGILLKISSEKTIPMEEEIRLCRTHLQVMGLRQDKSYRLDHDGIRGDELIPPMVLHTLVENGLTHGYAGKLKGAFLLKREELPHCVRFSLFNDGIPKEKREHKGEGTGLRYVRSRLEETFPGRWNLDSRAVENGWQVTLDIKP